MNGGQVRARERKKEGNSCNRAVQGVGRIVEAGRGVGWAD